MKRYISTFFCLVGALTLQAQNQESADSIHIDRPKSGSVQDKPQSPIADSTERFVLQLDSLHKAVFQKKSVKNLQLNPYLYRMMGPAIYYKGVTSGLFSLQSQDTLLQEQNLAMAQYYLSYPETIQYYDSQFQAEELITPVDEHQTKDDIKEVIAKVAKDEDLSKLDKGLDLKLKIEKPNFWKFSGTTQLQFTQNYISDNWYKGGNNNGTMLTQVQLYANYNDTRRITWENKLDMRLGFITTSADTCHTINTNNDRLNYYSKLNVKKTKTWSYTATVDAVTQFLPGYKTNKKDPYSNFLAPLDVTTSLGFDLKPSLKKGSISIALLPLSYKFRLIKTDEQNIHNTYGQQSDFKQDWGSRIEVNTNFTLAKNLTWKCRFYCFTSYKYVESEMENTFSYTFSKYISATFNTLFRFDDSRPPTTKDSKLGYIQLKEYLTFGLSYSF